MRFLVLSLVFPTRLVRFGLNLRLGDILLFNTRNGKNYLILIIDHLTITLIVY